MNYDILTNRKLETHEIQNGISQALSLKSSEVLVADNIPIDPISTSMRILCHAQNTEGEFKQMISIYVKDELISNSLESKESLETSLIAFCVACKCSCLVSDHSDNPYSMTLVNESGCCKQVYLSPVLLEEYKYVLATSDYHSS